MYKNIITYEECKVIWDRTKNPLERKTAIKKVCEKLHIPVLKYSEFIGNYWDRYINQAFNKKNYK
ncbi:hypothetical protein JCM1393_25290 [Clostridium carnis]